MDQYLRQILLAACCALLGACVSVDYREVRDMQATGSEFQRHLHKEYVAISQHEFDEQHFGASSLWASKGRSAAQGQSVAPEGLADRDIPAEHVQELTDARSRLMAAFGKGAAEVAPAPVAHAQAMFDCWVEEQEEDYQPRDIARCRSAFDQAMAEVDEALKPKPKEVEPPPPPPPPKVEMKPPPEPEIKRAYLVFFDFDEAVLTVDAQVIVRAAAAASGKGKVALIDVVGHADRSGPTRYNMGLSERRAEAVKAELTRLGVSARIVPLARGESEPLVPTDDGVREPQNRRASIVLK